MKLLIVASTNQAIIALKMKHSMKFAMKNIIISLLFLLLISCENENPVEEHTMLYEGADYATKIVYMHDEELNKEVQLKYNSGLFVISFIQLFQSSPGCQFTFYYSNNNYYPI